ncbi:MAG TPA: HAD-IIIC family phosphatase, partial [Chloroflexia bacterium]|nr:HAD-IIIC family phosphatase [Chloroflexia bacterium]
MSAPNSTTRPVKCVVWDLDDTLWHGVAVEGDTPDIPQPDPRVLALIAELERRGIVNSVASRNDPSMLDELLGHPSLKDLFVAPQVSWQPKSRSIRDIASRLNIGLDAVAFVDDSPFERAEVAHVLPEVLVLAPAEVPAALDTPRFVPSATAESAGRAQMYREEERRRAAESNYEGSRADFLRSCDMRLTIRQAAEADLPRVAELSERTNQLNSTGHVYTLDELRGKLADERWLLPVAALEDRFGKYGLIGAAIVDRQPPWPQDSWLLEHIMLSCRVEGRGIPAALLRWIMGEAKDAGMRGLKAVYRVSERNLPVRLLFRQMGFQTVGGHGLVTVTRDLTGPL